MPSSVKFKLISVFNYSYGPTAVFEFSKTLSTLFLKITTGTYFGKLLLVGDTLTYLLL